MCLAFMTFTFANFYIEDREFSIIKKENGDSTKMLHPHEEKKAAKMKIMNYGKRLLEKKEVSEN